MADDDPDPGERTSPTLAEVGEHPFLDRLCARLGAEASTGAPPVLIGPGDDCAVVGTSGADQALTTDSLVEGVHFRRHWLTPAELGARAAQVNLSDLAAMGARPTFLLAAIGAPADYPAPDLDALLAGCAEAATADGARLVGGNLTSSDQLTVTITAIGEVEGPALSRSGARPDDAIVVTGTLGDAAAAVASWEAGDEPAPELRSRFVAPRARVDIGRRLSAAGATAAIDVSDGLLSDLGHLCRASGVGARIDTHALPISDALRESGALELALEGGEDYELLATIPQDRLTTLHEISGSVAISVIGRCVAEPGIIVDPPLPKRPIRTGFDHFGGGRWT